MKTIKILRINTAILGVVMMLLLGFSSMPTQAAQVGFDFFYSNLSPHGSWYASADYGQVWRPNVDDDDWNPYYDGHWVYTDLGWTWVSDYDWGSIPYHYGTWTLDANLGWVWVPGYVWAPAWVVFRSGPDYIGWAPVAPQFSVGFSAGYSAPTSGPFVFVSTGNFLAPRVRTYVVPERQTTVILSRTQIQNNLVVENNVVVNRGPDPSLVERASGHAVRAVRIEQVRGVASEPRFSRADLRVDPERMRGGVRASEPVSSDRPMPGAQKPESERAFPRPGHRPAERALPAPRPSEAPPGPVVTPDGKRGQSSPPAKQDTGKKAKKPPKKKKGGNRETETGKEQTP